MVESSDKLQIEAVVSTTVRVNNGRDTTRDYDISAEATIRDNRVESIISGKVSHLETGGMLVAFSKSKGAGLSVIFVPANMTPDEQYKLHADINHFIAEVIDNFADGELINL